MYRRSTVIGWFHYRRGRPPYGLVIKRADNWFGTVFWRYECEQPLIFLDLIWWSNFDMIQYWLENSAPYPSIYRTRWSVDFSTEEGDPHMVIRRAVSHFLGRWITSLCPPAVIIEELGDPPDCSYQIIKKLWCGIYWLLYYRLLTRWRPHLAPRNLREDNLDVVHWIISSWVSRLLHAQKFKNKSGVSSF